MDLVSVIMPVKDTRETLERAVDSIQQQGYGQWELMLIDDGSADGSRKLCEQFEKKDQRIRLLNNPDPGIANALNLGIQSARGPYLARMDADDVSHENRLSEQVAFLEKHPDVGLVASQVRYLGDRSQHSGYAHYVDWTNELLSWETIRANRFVESPFAHPSVMFRKCIVQDNNGPYRQGDFPEDYELWLRWMQRGIRMAKIDKPLLDWYDPPNRLSRTDPRYSAEAFYAMKAQYLANWLIHEAHVQRPIWIWGAGRITRKRTQYLQQSGISFAGYLDIDARKQGAHLEGIPVIAPEQLDIGLSPFVISYVGSRGAREQIKQFLLEKGMREECDFILAA